MLVFPGINYIYPLNKPDTGSEILYNDIRYVYPSINATKS